MTVQTTSTRDTTFGVSLLDAMLMIRAYEEQLIQINQATGAAAVCSSMGQEACAVGVVRALGPQDRILTNHRSAGHLLARGADPMRMMAEVLGRSEGYAGGKSGALHLSVKELGVVLTSTIVGGELAMAPGVALAQKMGAQPPQSAPLCDETRADMGAARPLTAVFFGDGAACEGIFHEALNLAALWQLPLLFVCENNQWQAFVHRREAMAVPAVLPWAQAHGVCSHSVDGNDVEQVYAMAQEAVAQIRDTGRPVFLELQTWRQRGHLEPDNQAYVDPQERATWTARDPIERQARRLLERRALAPAELRHMRERAQAVMAAASERAQQSPWPSADTLTTQVHA